MDIQFAKRWGHSRSENTSACAEFEARILKLESQLDIYKPLLYSLVFLLVFAGLFFCCLIIPAKRRREIKAMLKVDRADSVQQLPGPRPGDENSGEAPEQKAKVEDVEDHSRRRNDALEIEREVRRKESLARKLPDYGEVSTDDDVKVSTPRTDSVANGRAADENQRSNFAWNREDKEKKHNSNVSEFYDKGPHSIKHSGVKAQVVIPEVVLTLDSEEESEGSISP